MMEGSYTAFVGEERRCRCEILGGQRPLEQWSRDRLRVGQDMQRKKGSTSFHGDKGDCETDTT
jgi:hypothetical protein